MSAPKTKRVPREYPIAQIIEIHDGDTVRMMVDQGFGSWQREWIRIRDLTTKELSEEGGPEAKALLVKVLNDNTSEGWVKLITFWASEGHWKEIKEERTFIRYVGRIVTPSMVDIGEMMRQMVAGTIMEGGL